MAKSQHVVIIGGGIIGAATAAELTRSGHRVTVIEKEDRWAAHQTGHNSGVIHAGPYYKPGSLKALMCIAGNRSMVEFAREHGIAHAVCGKLIVATSEREIPRLSALAERSAANGTPARLISGDQAREREPHVKAVAALEVDSTGIIDYAHVTRAMIDIARENGAELILGSAVTAIAVTPSEVVVKHEGGEVTADYLINCAGLQSDRIARLAGVEPQARIVPFRGEYFELTEDTRHLVNGLIYPVPDPSLPFLGVHLTRMVDGSVHAGPNAVFAFSREGYKWSDISIRDTWQSVTYPGLIRLGSRNIGVGVNEIVRSLSRRLFARSLARLVPEISTKDIVPAGSGVRAQAILPDGSLADDFILQRAERQLHVLNAPSPAATSSLEIAKHIAKETGLTKVVA